MIGIFIGIVKMSLTASYVMIAVLLVRLLLKRAPKIFSYALWGLVLFRLLCPIALESSFSLLPKASDLTDGGGRFAMTEIVAKSENSAIQPIIQNNPGDGVTSKTDSNNIPAPVITSFPRNTIGLSLSVIDMASIVWLSGVIILFLRTIYIYLRLRKKLSTATIMKDNIYRTDRIITPFVLGILKPRIYIPSDIADTELDYILMHEQKHISRFDHIVKPIAYMTLILHWFNPLVWISYYHMVKDMEMSCDESVIQQSKEDIRADYSVSMLNLSVKQSGLLIVLAFGKANVKSRIENVLNYKKRPFWVILVALLMVITTVGCLATNPISEAAVKAPASVTASNSKEVQTVSSVKDQTSSNQGIIETNPETELTYDNTSMVNTTYASDEANSSSSHTGDLLISDRKPTNSFVMSKTAVDSFTDIKINTGCTKLQLIPSDGYYIEINYSYLASKPVYSIKDKVLTFDSSKSIGNNTTVKYIENNYIKIYYPADTKFESLTINLIAGFITAKGCSADIISFNLNTVSLSMSDSDYKTMDIIGLNSGITCTNIKVDKLTAGSFAGDIIVDNSDIKDIEIANNSAKVDLNLKGSETDYNLNLQNYFNNITMDNRNVGTSYKKVNDTNCNLSVINNMGDINITFNNK